MLEKNQFSTITMNNSGYIWTPYFCKNHKIGGDGGDDSIGGKEKFNN